MAVLPQRKPLPGKPRSAREKIAARFSAATDVSVTAGSNTVTQSITWAATDIATAPAGIHVRAGDSLLLTCTGTGDVLEIDDNYDSDNNVFTATFTGTPGQTFVKTFATPGVYAVQARIDGIEIRTITVTVIGIDFQGSTACEVGFERVKAVTVLGGTADNVSFEPANVLYLNVQTTGNSGNTVNLKLKPTRFGEPRYIARVNATGAIVAGQVVDEFRMDFLDTKHIDIIEKFADGSYLVQTSLLFAPKILDLDIELTIFVRGVTFDDSTVVKRLKSDVFSLDVHGIHWSYDYSMIAQPNITTGTCHRMTIYQDGTKVGE